MGFFRQRQESYKAAVRVEKYRAAAVELRETDPETYARALSQADGTEAETAAKNDHDAYVALFLASFKDAQGEDPEALEADDSSDASDFDLGADNRPTVTDFDLWPDLDVDAIFNSLSAEFTSIQEEKGAPQYYPGWMVRRHVAFAVIHEAASIDPNVNSDGAALFAEAPEPKDMFFQENPQIDVEFERWLGRQHLTQIVDAIVNALSSPE